MSLRLEDNATNLPRLAPRAAESHKGDFGRALLVGGSRGMAGAIGLAGLATLRGGAGLVKLAVPREIQTTVASFDPSYMTVALAEDDLGRIAWQSSETPGAAKTLEPFLQEATAVALGPGLGRSGDLRQLVAELYQNIGQPLVIDADALNALAEQRDVLPSPGGPRILTPHVGEFARLVGDEQMKPATADSLRQAAIELARRCGIVLVLKAHRTLGTDGEKAYLNATGNPGMATGGSGDVLTGMITALLCQGLSPLDAARLGVHVHGTAGDMATAELGQVSMIASDLVRFLPGAFQENTGRKRPL